MDPDVRRAHRILAASVGLTWISTAMIAAPGPAAWVLLAADPGQAGVFFGVFSLSSAVGAAFMGRGMELVGRRRALVSAHLLAAAGFALAGAGYALGSLSIFAAGTVAFACAIGGIALTRLVAAELFAPAQRAHAVAVVQRAALFGAVLGPLLLVASDPASRLLGRAPESFVWFIAPPLFVATAILVGFAPLARPASAAAAASAGDAAIPPRPLVAGIVALVCAQAAMVTVMGVTGAALRHEGHGSGATALVMASHFVGMFALSTVVGRFADRNGRRPTILVGLATLAAGGALVAFAPGTSGLAAGLLLIGLGWSFAQIGGTVLLVDVLPASKRARVLGMVDFGTALGAATASFAGGWWYGGHGLPSLGLLAVVVVALPVVFTLQLREAKPGDYLETTSS